MAAGPALQDLAGVADILLGRHEDEHISLAAFALDVSDRLNGKLHVADLAVVPGDRPRIRVADLHREGPAGHVDHRCAAEGPGKFFGVDGSRGDHDLEIPPALDEPLEVAQNEVDVEVALVGFVDDDRVVGGQPAVGLGLGEQDAVGHDLDVGVPGRAVAETNLVAHRVAEGLAQFLSDPLGHRNGRDPAGLGVADHPVEAPAGGQAELRDHHGVILDSRDDLLLARRDGQRLRECKQREVLPSAGLGGDGRRQPRLDPVDGAVDQGRVPGPPQPVQAEAHRVTVPGHGLGQPGFDAAYSEAKGRHEMVRFTLAMMIENISRLI